MTILSLHAYSGHKHSVCHSKIEKHVHKIDLDCKLDLIKQQTSFLTINNFKLDINVSIDTKTNLKYSYLKNHYQLSFLLRGPPLYS